MRGKPPQPNATPPDEKPIRPVGIDTDIEKLSPAYLANYAVNVYTCDVFFDDLGAEKPTWKDTVGDFLYKWHFYRADQTRFWGTTNLDDEGFFGYMTERVLDRGKEMFYPLMLTGRSKRAEAGGERSVTR